MGELHFDEVADAALSELERHPSALLDEVNRWLDRLEADHGDRDGELSDDTTAFLIDFH